MICENGVQNFLWNRETELKLDFPFGFYLLHHSKNGIPTVPFSFEFPKITGHGNRIYLLSCDCRSNYEFMYTSPSLFSIWCDIPVVTSVSFCIVSSKFERSSAFPREERGRNTRGSRWKTKNIIALLTLLTKKIKRLLWYSLLLQGFGPEVKTCKGIFEVPAFNTYSMNIQFNLWFPEIKGHRSRIYLLSWLSWQSRDYVHMPKSVLSMMQYSCNYFRELSYCFVEVREILSISKRGTWP